MAGHDFKMYAVVPKWDDRSYQSIEDKSGASGFTLRNAEHDPNVFFTSRKDHAEHFARAQSAVNGGVELLILETYAQYFSKPSDVKKKIWKGGELVLAE